MTELVFQRADGFEICTCGATYSKILSLCPQCGIKQIKENLELKGQFLCDRGYSCEVGGLDGICCLSCPRFDGCEAPCFTAEQTREDDILCEFIQKVVK